MFYLYFDIIILNSKYNLYFISIISSPRYIEILLYFEERLPRSQQSLQQVMSCAARAMQPVPPSMAHRWRRRLRRRCAWARTGSLQTPPSLCMSQRCICTSPDAGRQRHKLLPPCRLGPSSLTYRGMQTDRQKPEFPPADTTNTSRYREPLTAPMCKPKYFSTAPERLLIIKTKEHVLL